MRRSCLLLSLLLAPFPVLAGGGGAPPMVNVSQSARPLWTAAVDRGSGIESAGYFGVFAVQQGHAVALDHMTGRLKWRSAASDVTGTPLQRQPLVLFSRKGGAVTALDFFTGKERWTVGGRDLPVRLARSGGGSSVLAFGNQIALTLDEPTGGLLWRVDAVSAEHTLSPAEAHSGPILILHSPSEGFLGTVYTAHDRRTGREEWRLRAGHGYLLGQDKRGLVFDLRDWHNLLGPDGTVQAGFVNPDTGKLTRGTLRVGVPDATAWQLEPGTLRLDGTGGTWALAVRVKDGVTRLIHTPARGRANLWALPGRETQVGSGASLVLTPPGALVGLPGGRVLLIDPKGGTQRTILPPGGGAPTISERLYGLRAIVRADQTVFLDEGERVQLRVPGRADAWAMGGDLQTVMVQQGTRLSGYAWPPFARSLRR